jgi:hypothetical protein
MKNAAVASSSAKLRYNAKPKIKVWTTEIKSDTPNNEIKIWKDKGKPRDTYNPICKEKKESKKESRRLIRVELAKQRDEEKELIVETKAKDMRLFHKLVRNNRKKGNDVIMDLNVNGIQYEGEENIITGFREHFRQLATLDPEMDIDSKYHNMVEEEIKIINEIVADKNISNINSDEIMKAIRSINRGKSADYHGLTTEHIVNAGKDMENLLLVITNEIFRQGKVPETLKVGLLTPIFKNKGLKSQATHYRGITVLPVISKIVEAIIKERIQKQVIETQNRKQRGFASGSSPINSALPVEECYREVVDNNAEGILLDAKAAFDKVTHRHMERKVYQAGIDDKHWVIIKSLHENAESSIKCAGQISEPFQVNQGV